MNWFRKNPDSELKTFCLLSEIAGLRFHDELPCPDSSRPHIARQFRQNFAKYMAVNTLPKKFDRNHGAKPPIMGPKRTFPPLPGVGEQT